MSDNVWKKGFSSSQIRWPSDEQTRMIGWGMVRRRKAEAKQGFPLWSGIWSEMNYAYTGRTGGRQTSIQFTNRILFFISSSYPKILISSYHYSTFIWEPHVFMSQELAMFYSSYSHTFLGRCSHVQSGLSVSLYFLEVHHTVKNYL